MIETKTYNDGTKATGPAPLPLQSPTAQAVAGWKLVPVEPTQEMIDAWATACCPPLRGLSDEEVNKAWATADWNAMLAAAPTPEATQPDDTKMWAVHIIGPDDVHAVPNREIADAACVALNWSFKRQKLADMCRAEVIEWTHGYETWAAEKDLFRLKAVPSAEATQPTQAEAPSDWRDTIQGAIDELPYQHYLIPRLTQLLAAQQAERAPMTDEQMRAEWFAAGGEIHGPRIETVTMPESSYFRFRRALATQQAGQGEPLDMPLPCDITVGHVTMSKGVSLRTLVFRMQALYELAQEAATPPAPQQPEALAQQERDSGEQWSIWKLMLDALLNVRMSIRFKSLSPEQQQQIDAAIRAARSSEGGV